MYIPDLIRKHGLRRGLSPRTIKTYSDCIRRFFRQCKKEDPRYINKKDITDYLDALVEKGSAGSTLNTHLNALRFLYNDILHKRLLVNFHFSRLPKRMPVYLSKIEVISLFNAIKNKKHRLMVMLLYSAGLRVSELINLKKSDFECDLSYGWVRCGKGNKDRPFLVAESLKHDLLLYLRKNCLYNHSYLFSNANGFPLSRATVFVIIKKAAKKSGIIKNIHPHTLRHSFATHLIENKYDIITTQSLLGHSSSKTTMVYLHCAGNMMFNVKSPLDMLLEKNDEKISSL